MCATQRRRPFVHEADVPNVFSDIGDKQIADARPEYLLTFHQTGFIPTRVFTCIFACFSLYSAHKIEIIYLPNKCAKKILCDIRESTLDTLGVSVSSANLSLASTVINKRAIRE